MIKKYFKFILIFSLALNIGVIAAVSYHVARTPNRRMLSPEHRINYAQKFWKEKLNLNADQLKELEKLFKEQWEIKHAAMQKISAHRAKIFDQFQLDAPDQKVISGELAEIHLIMSELLNQLTDHLFKVKGILTPDQRKEFLKFISDRFLFEPGFENMAPPGGMHRRDRFSREHEDSQTSQTDKQRDHKAEKDDPAEK
jgi:Spy/CpxP family protein refolding chaperone